MGMYDPKATAEEWLAEDGWEIRRMPKTRVS